MLSNRKIVFSIILLITIAGVAYFILVFIPQRAAQQTYDGAKQIGHDLNKAFQFTPEISVHNTIIIQQHSPILELATVSQKFHHTYTWENTRLYSKKEIKIEGTFEAKIGFDLHEKFIITLDENKAVVKFPEPKLLSLESLQDVKFEDANGIINWINTDDRSAAINSFTQHARKFADNEAFKQKAIAIMQKELLTILKPYVKQVEIVIGKETLIKDFDLPDTSEQDLHPIE